MKRNLYTKEEIILCTCIARFGRNEVTENDIHTFSKRSLASIKMKVQNIASMLHEHGYEIDDNVSMLTGKPQGEKGRKTNWEIVEKIANLTKDELSRMCDLIIG